jgi:hypothetical protein
MFALGRRLLTRSLAACAVALCPAGAGAVPAVSGTAPAAGSWGRAIEVTWPGRPECGRVRPGLVGVVRVDGQLRGRRVLHGFGQ